jgi:hypothetical protein
MIKKCLYRCDETGPVASADESFICELHMSYLRISASLQPHELTLTRNLVHDLAEGKREFTGQGVRQVPPKPVAPPIIREDNGDIRVGGTMMRWFTPEQTLEKLNGRSGMTPEPELGDAE